MHKSEMFKITWNASRLRNPCLHGNRLAITQTGLYSLARQVKDGSGGNVFPSDGLWRVPVVGSHYVGTTEEVCEIISEQQLGSLQAKCAEQIL